MLTNPILSYAFSKTLTFPLLKFMSKPTDLKILLSSVKIKKIAGPKTNPIIYHLAAHSQFVQPNGLFFAIPGKNFNGNDFIEQAISKGASVIVTEKILPRLSHIIQVQVANIREAVSQISHTFYNKPDQRLRLVGITGTSGKTTTSWLLRHLYSVLNEQTGLLGSLHYDLGQRILPASRTTPDALSLTSYLEEMVQANKTSAILEVSSHAIEQKRTSALTFETAAFTNLSLEHLDYHKTMEAYYQTKKQLFFQKNLKNVVVNVDDAYGQRLISELPASLNVVTIGIKKPGVLQAKQIVTDFSGTSFTLSCPQGEWTVKTPLLGLFNVYNCLTALGICYAQGYDLSTIVNELANFYHVPGRLEPIKNNLGVNIFVDFAHKPEALKNVLQTLRPLTEKNLHVVFGCGGDRDRTKRPIMTHIAVTYADSAWATSDNPRTESQQQIFEDMKQGLNANDRITFIQDRTEAICKALQFCQPGDCLIIAGKGNEQYQEIGTQFFPYDDRKVVEAYDQSVRA